MRMLHVLKPLSFFCSKLQDEEFFKENPIPHGDIGQVFWQIEICLMEEETSRGSANIL